jgi:ribA/ribD-fused uncharacterized protein
MPSFTVMHAHQKVSESEDYVFFLNGPLSQWHKSTFQQRLIYNGELFTFSHAEQYMMAGKAVLFDDYETLEDILKAKTPDEQKALGKKVKNFNQTKWDSNARKIVLRGNLAKFSQNEDLKHYLLSFDRNKRFVEGAWYDPVWGVKLAWDNPLILNPANWQGTNWLGGVHDIVRQILIHDPSLDLMSDA